MQVTQTKAEGLSREFEVAVPAAELLEKLDARIEEIRPQMRLKGFRPGKVPASHVKRMFGKSIMSEVVEGAIQEANQKAIEDADVRPASQPHPHLKSDMEQVLDGKADLEYHMHFDVMPEFEPIDVATLSVERPVCEIDESEVEEAIGKIAEQNTQYEARGDEDKAEDGDAVIIDFLGKIDGEPFEGGKAEQQAVVIGSNRFIPGFEEQLIGVKKDDETELNVTFPEEYASEDLAGKDAVFEVKVHEVREPKTPELDDEFAKGLGLEGIDQLREMVTGQLQAEHDSMSRQKAKRALLDELDKAHDFELPSGMVNAEFNQIWQQLQQEKQAGRLSDEDAEKSDEDLEKEYREIAERRVRLGLVLAEIGRGQEIQITQEEVNAALIAEARRFPGQEQQVIEMFQKNPQMVDQLRAPIYEDKVVDHILETATVTDKAVSKEDLFADEEDL